MLVGEGRPYVVLVAVSKETDERSCSKRANAQLKSFPALGARAPRDPVTGAMERGQRNADADAQAQASASCCKGSAREIDAAYAEPSA